MTLLDLLQMIYEVLEQSVHLNCSVVASSIQFETAVEALEQLVSIHGTTIEDRHKAAISALKPATSLESWKSLNAFLSYLRGCVIHFSARKKAIRECANSKRSSYSAKAAAELKDIISALNQGPSLTSTQRQNYTWNWPQPARARCRPLLRRQSFDRLISPNVKKPLLSRNTPQSKARHVPYCKLWRNFSLRPFLPARCSSWLITSPLNISWKTKLRLPIYRLVCFKRSCTSRPLTRMSSMATWTFSPMYWVITLLNKLWKSY